MATQHSFSASDLGISDALLEDDINEPTVLKILNEQILNNKISMNRGDIAAVQPKYRNDFTQISNGSQLIELSRQLDDYGHAPEEFVVTHTDFAPDWWDDGICHNGIFYLDRTIQDTMNFQIKGSPKEAVVQADVTIGNTLWCCQQDNIEDWTGLKPAYEDIYFSTISCEFPEFDDCQGKCFFLFHKTDWQKRNDE